MNWRCTVAALERSHSPSGRLMVQRMLPQHQEINAKSGVHHHRTLTVNGHLHLHLAMEAKTGRGEDNHRPTTFIYKKDSSNT